MVHKFYSVSAPAGSGKTFALSQHAVDLANNGQKVMIVQPTKQLIRETISAIRKADPDVGVDKIHSEQFGKSNVLGRVIAHMQNTNPATGEILLISHEILSRMPATHRQFWHLFIDEMPSGFDAHYIKMAVTHDHLTQHLKADEPLVDDVVAVEALNVGGLRDLALNKTGDAGLAVFKNIAEDVLNPDKLVCVSKPSYDRLIGVTKSEAMTAFFSMLQPSFLDGFESVTLMGALLEETELYRLWEKLLDVVWVKHPILTKALRYKTHQNGARLTLKYLIDGNWSKHHGSLPHHFATILEAVSEAMEQELGPDFLYQVNNDVSQNLFENGHKLPAKSHGQNSKRFISANNVALTMAINHPKAASDFLKLIGFTAHEIKTVLQYQNEYQAMMRCSLRDPNATDPVTVCVVSKGSAEWLAKHFPGCKVERIVTDIPEPRSTGRPVTNTAKTGAERQAAYRAKRQAEKKAKK